MSATCSTAGTSPWRPVNEAAAGPAVGLWRNHPILTFSACGPFCPWVMSNSTFWPSSRLR